MVLCASRFLTARKLGPELKNGGRGGELRGEKYGFLWDNAFRCKGNYKGKERQQEITHFFSSTFYHPEDMNLIAHKRD